MLELEQEHLRFSFLVLLKPEGWLLNDSTPLLLCCGQHSEYRLQSLAVEFALNE